MKKKVILFGGSFNPIHNGHLAIVEKALKKLEADEVWFMPLRTPRWKKVDSSNSDRIKMIKLAIADYPQYKYCDYEIKHTKKGEPTYTYNTMVAFREMYPDVQFYFLIGTDQLELLPKWYKIEELAKMVTFVLANRPGYQLKEEIVKAYGVRVLGFSGPFVSSSMIRVFDSREIPEPVTEYIRRKGLFLESKLSLELSPTRFNHSKRVAVIAKRIAKANKYDVDKAYIAAILHDCAKELPFETADKLMRKQFSAYQDCPPQIYHQFLGSVIAKSVYNIIDPEILQAIEYHTTGHVPMSTLDKIIFCADKIEPGRQFQMAKPLINACINDIETGFIAVLENNYQYLLRKTSNRPERIYRLSGDTYRAYVKGEKYGQA